MSYPNQQGAVLITGLMILLIATIIGVSAVQNTAFDERMANNSRGEQLAFQAAEAALIEAKSNLRNADLTTNSLDLNADCQLWQNKNSVDNIQAINERSILASQPIYVIRDLSKKDDGTDDYTLVRFCNPTKSVLEPEVYKATDRRPYRITACAQGNLNTATTVLEEVVCQ